MCITPSACSPSSTAALSPAAPQSVTRSIGTMLMPPLFGVLAGRIAVTLLPLYLLALLALMTAMTERLERKTGQRARP